MDNERRRFKRFDVALDVAFRTSSETDDYVRGITKNFSRSGLCVEVGSFDPSLDSLMEMKVKLPDEEKFIPVLGNIAWKEVSTDKCWLGIELVEMNSEAKSHILDYAYDRWLDENLSRSSQK